MAFDEHLAARVRKALSGRADVRERKMFGGLTFMIGGHMACGVLGDRLVVRLGPEGGEIALREPHTSPMDFTGRQMMGFVYVDPEGLTSAPRLRSWVNRSVAFATALPKR